MKTDKRTEARELAMQALYQLDIQGAELLNRLQDEFLNESSCDGFTRQLAYDWIKGTWDQLKMCDDLISPAIHRWQFSRLSPVDKSILRLSVYQLKCCADIPPKVVLNEAIEMAKKFSSEKSPRANALQL